MKKPVKESDEAIARLRDRLLVKIKRHLQLILSLEGLTDKARKELFDSFQQVVPDALLTGGFYRKQIESMFTAVRTRKARAVLKKPVSGKRSLKSSLQTFGVEGQISHTALREALQPSGTNL